MAARAQDMPSVRTNQAARSAVIIPAISFRTAAYLVTALLAVLAIYAVVGNVVGWANERLDDLRYGEVRTYHTEAIVGQDDGPGSPTHFTAINMNGQVVIMQFPGGDAAKARVITGPYLFGTGEARTPVTLEFADVNKDGTRDMIVIIKNEHIVYLNRDGQFQALTAEERSQLMAEGQ